MQTVDMWILLSILLLLIFLSIKKPLKEDILKGNVKNLKKVNITIITDGENTKTAFVSGQLKSDMVNEIAKEASIDVFNDKSTVNTLKSNLNKVARRYNYNARIMINSQFGRDKLPFSAIVKGTSMFPTLKNGQNITALKTRSFNVGDIVIARHFRYGLIIKRVAALDNGKVFLKSDNREMEKINREKILSDGTIKIETIFKSPLDTWQPVGNVIAVVKHY